MRLVTLSVTMLVVDDTRPDKWVAETLSQAMDRNEGEVLLDVTITTDEPQRAE